MFYVYLLARPNVDPFVEPFYVGKGKGRRIFAHEREARRGCSCHKCNVIRKVWAAGVEVQRVKVLEGKSEQAALYLEITLIALYRARGVQLCNLTDGGDGTAGRALAPESRAKIRIARQRQTFSNETREKFRDRHQALWSNPEYRAKTLAVLRGHVKTPEQIEKQRAKVKGVPKTEEHKAKLRAAYLQWRTTPEGQGHIEKMIEARSKPGAKKSRGNTGKKASAETREKLRLARKGKNTIFTDEQARHIRSLHAAGQGIASLARQFKVNYSTMNRLLKGRTYQESD